MKHSILTPTGVIERDADLYAKKTKAIADRKAGNAKLLSLGLTQDQVTSLTGYDPSLDQT